MSAKAPSFFPSRTLSLYMAKLFVTRTAAVLIALVLVLQSLDLLSESAKVLAAPGNGDAAIWKYVSLRVPELIARFLPFSVLLGTIVALSTLNQNSEVVAMKASGLSAHQVLAPLVLAALGVSAVSFVFNERIVSRATATLDAWQAVDYASIPVNRGDRTNVWARDGNNLIRVTRVNGRGEATVLEGVTVYERDGGRLISVLTAETGRREDGQWRLDGAKRFLVGPGQLEPVGAVRLGPEVRPDQFSLGSVNADGLSFIELSAAIDDLKAAGRPTKALEGSLWHKLSAPLSAVLMPLLGAVSAFGLARSGKLFVRAVIGMALGFAYFVADNFALAMGNIGAYPPFLAAWAPFLLFLLIGEAVLVRTEE
ncbi:LPS export ABC transporter permease LptG [Sphingomonas sp. FW199]|uniref:LPS export ABC transporter permease LptG n=1 Tax=Sphingomonas sp. FW199 TaxID=3400217 RepID=UPI003CF9B79B